MDRQYPKFVDIPSLWRLLRMSLLGAGRVDGEVQHQNLCVIDAMPEIHATREFARRHSGRVYMNQFMESQRGSYAWDHKEHLVKQNRTEALDASRQVVRDGKVVLPRGGEVIREFASHMAQDVKELVEDEDTGAKAYKYKKTGTNHYSFAFTYDCIAWSRDRGRPGRIAVGVIPDPDFYDPILHDPF